ncbi:DNA-processing protein DprA [Sciscionella marina]|uniref:DNA-processing protein DprA n=1 Tax=Sciscionella marina TaxID=508770 RepID=UPI00036B8BE4|nr:DNA-processing protein DprA [Sciscionella marina]
MDDADVTEQAALLALLSARSTEQTRQEIATNVLAEGSALAVWRATQPPTLLDPVEELDQLTEAKQTIIAWRAAGLSMLTIADDHYPTKLREVHQAPALLFTKGTVVPKDRAVAVVGSRNASAGGREFASQVARSLVAEGITVVAGLAAGIDTAAHSAALAAGGRTVAVVGTGIDRYYPNENRALQDQIGEDGLVLSQFLPGSAPRSQHFPQRNATMSGYSLATVIVEAGEHSGTRIQARLAVEHGRPVVLTTSVLNNTDWAKELRHRPRVHIASTSEEVISIVGELAREDLEVERALSPLGTASA